jgi:hypothetical protein
MNHHTLEVDLKDLIAWNDELAQKVQEQPGEMVPLVSCRNSVMTGRQLISSSNQHYSALPVNSSIPPMPKEEHRQVPKQFQICKSLSALAPTWSHSVI